MRGVRKILQSSPSSPAAARMVEGERASSQEQTGGGGAEESGDFFTVYVWRLGFLLVHIIQLHPNQGKTHLVYSTPHDLTVNETHLSSTLVEIIDVQHNWTDELTPSNQNV